MADSERIYVSDITPGSTIDQVFLLRDKQLRTASNGGLYIMCTLADRTGTLASRMWRANEAIFNAMPLGGFMRVRGRSETYRGNLQFIIEAVQPIAAAQVDMAEFVAASENDADQMFAEVSDILLDVKNRWLKLLLKKFLADRKLMDNFKRCPAAVEMHQAYLGGLLEHTLHIMRSCRAVVQLYPQLNADLLLAGAFLHDIGKTAELAGEMSFSYTTRGQLVGHITLAACWVQQTADKVAEEVGEPFPPKIIDLLQHIILSHHGVYEYGSPKLPMIPEAIALHYLDNLDAKMNMFERLISTDPDASSDFTAYNRALEVKVYKHSGSLEDLDSEAAQPGLYAD